MGLISLGSLLPSITEKLQLSNLQAGTLTSILPAGILVGSLLFGPIVDRYSYRNLLIICSLLIVVGFEGIAFSTNLFGLQLSFFTIGVVGGALNGGTSALVADISDDNPEKRGANLSLLGVFYGVGALGIPSFLAVITRYYSYETVLSYLGLVLLIPIAFFFFVRFPAPKHSQSIPFKAYLKMFGNKPLVTMAFFCFFHSAYEGIISNWSTTFLETNNGISTAQALVALSVYMLALTITRLLLAGLLRRISPYWVLVISMALLFVGILFLYLPQTQSLYLLILVLFGIGTAGGFPIILGYVGEMYADLRGTAFSFILVVALSGNILINSLTGVVAHHYGIEQFPMVLLFCALGLGLIVVFRLPRIIKNLS